MPKNNDILNQSVLQTTTTCITYGRAVLRLQDTTGSEGSSHQCSGSEGVTGIILG